MSSSIFFQIGLKYDTSSQQMQQYCHDSYKSSVVVKTTALVSLRTSVLVTGLFLKSFCDMKKGTFKCRIPQSYMACCANLLFMCEIKC